MARLTKDTRCNILTTMLSTLFQNRIGAARTEIEINVARQIKGAIPAAVHLMLKTHPEFVISGTTVGFNIKFPLFKGDVKQFHYANFDEDYFAVNTQFPHPQWNGNNFEVYLLDKAEYKDRRKKTTNNEHILLATPELIHLVRVYRGVLAERALAKTTFSDVLDSVNTTKALLEKWPGADKYINPALLAKSKAPLAVRADLAIKLERQAIRLAKPVKE